MSEEPSIAPRRRQPVPFVGRLAEFALALTEAEARRSTLLTGPAGVGKSRLAQEVARHLADRSGWAVVTRHATPALQQLPLGLFADVIAGGPGRPTAGEAVIEAYRSWRSASPSAPRCSWWTMPRSSTTPPPWCCSG